MALKACDSLAHQQWTQEARRIIRRDGTMITVLIRLCENCRAANGASLEWWQKVRWCSLTTEIKELLVFAWLLPNTYGVQFIKLYVIRFNNSKKNKNEYIWAVI